MKSAPEILMDLVSIPSVSSMSNRPIIEYALQFLGEGQCGWKTDLHSYSDGTGAEKVNMVARAGHMAAGPAELALVCHTDTVPFDPTWHEAVYPVLRDGRLFGRGSCDVKGFLACVLEALSRVDCSRLERPLALVLTADEEVGCVGARYLASKGAIQSRSLIIGEPTGLTPVRAGKGYGLGEVVVRGREAHSAFPERGHSAIRDAARVLERLDDVARQLASQMDSDFDPPFTTLNTGLIKGGRAKNIVPGECRITVEWRPIPGQDASWAATLIEEELANLSRDFPGFDGDFRVSRLDSPFHASQTGNLASLLESLTGRHSTTVAFGTEASHFAAVAAEVIVFGPGDMTVAHKSGEFVAVEELRQCVTYLGAAIEKLCGNSG